jgi:mRNA-degrading endonuclease RelE of RelBE toxin-antitoxin system
MAVRLTADAVADIAPLPTIIKGRLEGIRARLEFWPQVSGAKPLTREWAGHYRIRTGDYRVIFRAVGPDVVIVRVMHRSTVYDP